MSDSPDSAIIQLFTEIFRKKDYRFKLWMYHAENQLFNKTQGKFAKHFTAEDIILDIVAGVLSGRIKWNREEVPNISTFMYHQVRSRISNLVKKELHRLQPGQECNSYYCIPEWVDPDELPAELIDQLNEENDLKELRDIVRCHLKKDIMAYFVYEEILAGSGNKAAAENLGISVDEVVNSKKRIQNNIKKLKRDNLL